MKISRKKMLILILILMGLISFIWFFTKFYWYVFLYAVKLDFYFGIQPFEFGFAIAAYYILYFMTVHLKYLFLGFLLSCLLATLYKRYLEKYIKW